ncbi:MAG: helix-turn-helix domain-containing protein [Planctomycetota bacterium]|nr:helix-turn-helix domain-containing protein [Planctomycetota bacterium]
MPAHHSSQPWEGQRALRELGHRLRARRESLGLSVSDLAVASGVSRRYLTEAEAGRANLSVLRLLDLARALEVPIQDLVRESDAPRERIALVGLRGAGKSTLGRQLALRLEVPFVELDQRVEALAGAPLGEIFSLHGEAGYHRFEAEALEAVLSEGERLVLAVGGSIVTRPSTFERLKRACRTVWLRASPAEHYERVRAQGDRRPMADRPGARAELEALLRGREPLYAACELSVDTRGRNVAGSLAALEQVLTPAGERHGT